MTIVIGPDLDTCEPRLVHVVVGREHDDKQALCGADTLWGYYDGDAEQVTCPACLSDILVTA